MSNETIKAKLCATVTGGRGYGISHSWDGTVLTVASDSGSSSADLMGPRGPAGGELYTVELRLEDGVYVSDKSFAEVKEHIDYGDVVACEFVGLDSRTRCQLTTWTEYSAMFVMQSVLGADEYFTLTAEGVSHAAADWAERETPTQVQTVLNGNTLTVTAVYGWASEVTEVTLDDSGVPVSVTKDGVTTALTWEGFDG